MKKMAELIAIADAEISRSVFFGRLIPKKVVIRLSERKQLGLTQVQLAELLVITPEYLSMIENGKKNPSKKILHRFGELIIQFNKFPSESEDHRKKRVSRLAAAGIDVCAMACERCSRRICTGARAIAETAK